MQTNDLTMDGLLALMRKFPPAPRDPIDDLLSLKPRMLGMDVYVEPDVPRLQLREIKLSDGTPLVSKEFRDEYNAWLAARFGYREPLCKDKMLFIGTHRLMVSKSQFAMISNLTA